MFRKILLAVLMLSLPVAVTLMVNLTAPETGLPVPTSTSAISSGVRADLEGQYLVDRVIDGDTIEVRDEYGVIHRVRYIGVDTPEMEYETQTPECFAVEATNRNAELVRGRQVVITRDVSETDTYGRLLRYVTVDGADVGRELIAAGYAKPLTIPPDVARAEEYREIATVARSEAKGLWGSRCQ